MREQYSYEVHNIYRHMHMNSIQPHTGRSNRRIDCQDYTNISTRGQHSNNTTYNHVIPGKGRDAKDMGPQYVMSFRELFFLMLIHFLQERPRKLVPQQGPGHCVGASLQGKASV